MGFNSNDWNRIRYSIYEPFYDYIGKLFAKRRARSISLLNPKRGEKVLILGAGTGLDLEFVPEGVDISAIDITPAMVKKMKVRAEKLGIQGDFRVMDGQNLDFPDNSFDCVILHLILAVIPDPDRCITEVERVLRPGGRVAVFDKFLPDGEKASLPRELLNFLTRALFSDINRKLGAIIEGTRLKLQHEESAGFGGNFKIAIFTKENQ